VGVWTDAAVFFSSLLKGYRYPTAAERDLVVVGSRTPPLSLAPPGRGLLLSTPTPPHNPLEKGPRLLSVYRSRFASSVAPVIARLLSHRRRRRRLVRLESRSASPPMGNQPPAACLLFTWQWPRPRNGNDCPAGTRRQPPGCTQQQQQQQQRAPFPAGELPARETRPGRIEGPVGGRPRTTHDLGSPLPFACFLPGLSSRPSLFCSLARDAPGRERRECPPAAATAAAIVDVVATQLSGFD
jgi:hypothetical protein